jgi:hypothetical protein
MQGSKIRLSDAEKELFCNAEIILTKNSIVQKTVLLLEGVQEIFVNENVAKNYNIPGSPKISKGENYLGLPYTILDYPRIAKDGDLFFIRSMFWWGNFFSSTLQLSGSYKKTHAGKLKKSYHVLSDATYFIGINTDPWVHHFEEDNYEKIKSLTRETFSVILEESPNIKIATKWPLNEWDSAANKLVESWKLLMKLIT